MAQVSAALDHNPREVLGGNNPPQTAIDLARPVFKDISEFLTEHPVIQTQEASKAASVLVTRGKNTLAGLKEERTKRTSPLYAEIETIEAPYRKPLKIVKEIYDELGKRLTAYMNAVEDERKAEAERKRLAAEQAEAAAREAERIEKEAKENAAVGEIVNVSAAIVEADKAFDQFGLASREAARAEREIPVRIGTGIGKAVSMRSREFLEVQDLQLAINDMGLTDNIREAILTSARAFRKENGKLPAGITSHTERAI